MHNDAFEMDYISTWMLNDASNVFVSSISWTPFIGQCQGEDQSEGSDTMCSQLVLEITTWVSSRGFVR